MVSLYSEAAFYSVVNLCDGLKREQSADDPLQSRSVQIKISSCTIFISADLKHLHFAAKLRCCQATAWYSARSELYSVPSCVFNLSETLYAVFAFPVNNWMYSIMLSIHMTHIFYCCFCDILLHYISCARFLNKDLLHSNTLATTNQALWQQV